MPGDDDHAGGDDAADVRALLAEPATRPLMALALLGLFALAVVLLLLANAD